MTTATIQGIIPKGTKMNQDDKRKALEAEIRRIESKWNYAKINMPEREKYIIQLHRAALAELEPEFDAKTPWDKDSIPDGDMKGEYITDADGDTMAIPLDESWSRHEDWPQIRDLILSAVNGKAEMEKRCEDWKMVLETEAEIADKRSRENDELWEFVERWTVGAVKTTIVTLKEDCDEEVRRVGDSNLTTDYDPCARALKEKYGR